jgi:hypothetical protein
VLDKVAKRPELMQGHPAETIEELSSTLAITEAAAQARAELLEAREQLCPSIHQRDSTSAVLSARCSN